ncbi:MAG: ABC transporter substrate binding protein [Candidatus Korobacteraceae bacterium]
MPPCLEEQIAGRSWGVGRRNPGHSHFSESVRAAGRTLILSVFAVALLVSRSSAASPTRDVRRVLIINDLGIISSPGFSEADQAVLASLQKSPYRIELYQESLELTLFPDRVSQDRFRAAIIQKYSARKPDVIIAAGPASLKFIVQLYDKFQGTPIIFCAIWGGIPDELRHGVPFTGVLAQLHPEGTLNAALHLLPGTKHVVVVGGVGKFDAGFEAIAKQGFHGYESKLEFEYLIDLTMPALLERLKHLPSDTIVYHTAITQDAAGNYFIDSAQSIPMVASAANAPVFVMDDVDLRAGTVGGDLVNWADDGRIAGEMAARVLNGEKTQDIPVVTSNHAYMFDWRALKRWGMNEKDLPPGSIVLHRHPGFWELYKQYAFAAIFLILVQSAAILGLLWQRARRRKTEAELIRSEEKFSKSFRQSPLAISIASTKDGCYLDVNETFERQTGWCRDDVIGRNPLDIDLWVEPHQRSRFIKQLLAEGNVRDLEVRIRRKDGQIRTILNSAELIEVNGKPCTLSVIADVTERKQAEEALASLSGRLIEAQDEERKRIAREIHDDYNQRVAMVAIDLERLAESVGDSSGETSRTVHELFDRVSELGADLHSLSHRLHSATLESLGLLAGLEAYCKEFAEQQGVQVDLVHQNVPRRVPADAALCMFRITQEALRNVKRHSGANRAEVRLEQLDGMLHLSVSDRGRGFNSNQPSAERGIGIHSMEERLRLLGGKLEIQSRPMEGTRIDAWLPLKVASAA